jgi:hypothetical protein
MSWYVLSGNKTPEALTLSKLYLSISKTLYDARALFRIGKSMFEVKRIMIILKCINDTDKFTLITNVLSRACYFFHWLFDNVFILLKILNRDIRPDSPPSIRNPKIEAISRLCRQISRVFWLLGIICFMIYCLKTVRKTYTDESDLKVAALDKMTVAEVRKNLEVISQLRHDYWFNLFRAISDLMICLNENEIPINVLGKRLNNGVEGFFGMASSSVHIYSSLIFVLSNKGNM